MFTTQLHFQEILEWFKDSSFEYLMLFLPSCDTKDRKLDDFIIRNQDSINLLTGEKIAYIACASDDLSSPFIPINKRPLHPDAIRTHVYISIEVCDYYSFGQYNLPALILISKDLVYKLYPISTEIELDSYFTPISVVTRFLDDYKHVEREKWKYESLESVKKSRTHERNCLEEKTRLLEESLRENERDENLALRIDTNYCLLFNHLKGKKVKQNIFEDVFAYTLNEERVVRELVRLGLDENLRCYAKELVNDLKKITNFKKFQAQYGCVTSQIKRLISQYQIEIKDNEEKIKKLTNEILDIEKKLLIAPDKLKECDDELAKILSVYGEKLNNTIFVSNGSEILQNILHNYSSGLIEILSNVKEKTNRINIIIERLNKQIEKEGFDVFISSKSQDYKKAFEVYSFLLEKGYKPFLADPVLREIGTDSYGYLIRRIVNKSSFMIVYASDIHYMTTPYVSAEWNQFLDELSSGIKYGKLFSIVSPSVSAQMLPPGISTRQFFTFDNYKKSLLDYLQLDKNLSSVC